MRCLWLVPLLVALSTAKTLDNRLVGTPTVTCGPEEIRIAGESEAEYEGTVFVKNWHRSGECVSAYTLEDNTTKPVLALPLDKIASCGLDMRRNPDTKELELFAVFVFSFHPAFVTAGDRAFAVHCVFQQRQLTVATNVDFISDITTREILGSTSSMPTVTLDIVPGRVPDPNLQLSEHVNVGQPLMLVWHLSELSELYGLRVLSCSVESRLGQKMLILDSGCTKDTNLISDVRYSDDRKRAFADATAFKFADVDDVWFKCTTKLCLRRFEHLLVEGKDQSELCNGEPKCPSNRPKRAADHDLEGLDDPNTIVVTGRLNVEDEFANFYKSAGPEAFVSSDELRGVDSTLSSWLHHETCMSRPVFVVTSALTGSAFVTLLLVLSVAIFLRLRRK